MSVRDQPVGRARFIPSPRRQRLARDGGSPLAGGGPDGNEVLTTSAGIVLLVLLAALGVTIVFIGRLLWEHLFLGLVLLGPIALKMASTAYRFARYYTGDRAYVEKGPPWTPLRLTAPLVVLTTVAVFATGIVLLGVGPLHRDPWALWHKVAFIVWIAVTVVHVVGHLPEVSRLLGVRAEILQLPGIRTDLERVRAAEAHPGADTPPTAAAEARLAGGPGSAARLMLLGASVLLGLIIALALIPDFHAWISLPPLLHHQEH